MRRSPALLIALSVATAAGLTACGPADPGTEATSSAVAAAAEAPALPEPINIVTAPPETATPSATPSSAPPAAPSSARPSASSPAAGAKASASAAPKAGGAAAPAANPTSFGYSATADSPAAVAAALKQAKADGRNVLLDFGASWCGNCKALDKVLGDAKVQGALNSSYHFVQIDIGDHSTTNFNLLRTYDSQGSYKMPVLIVVTPDGKVRTDTNTGALPALTASGFTGFLKQWAA
ncbi:thioredoxin family protein [Kitasatospora sp. NPDC094015]|uniref:thioredoxin family protein n=1 Tax=Kitasatospora sp. NPDC094015 TaxID=3155205 RepID=UPI0033252518